MHDVIILRADAFGSEKHLAIQWRDSGQGNYHFGWIPTEMLHAHVD